MLAERPSKNRACRHQRRKQREQKVVPHLRRARKQVIANDCPKRARPYQLGARSLKVPKVMDRRSRIPGPISAGPGDRSRLIDGRLRALEGSCLPHSDASNASAVCRSVIAVSYSAQTAARHFSSGRPSNSTCLRCAACFRLSQSVSSPSPPLPACQLMRPARSRFLPESHLRPNLFKMYPQWFFPAGRFPHALWSYTFCLGQARILLHG